VEIDLEYCLHLGKVGERMRSSKHFDDETAKRPNISFSGVTCLTNDFGSHPVYTSLQGGTVGMVNGGR